MMKNKSYQLWAVLFTAPNIILFVLFFAIPAILSLGYSFTNYNGFSTPEFVGLDNYVELFKDDQFLKVVLQTFVYAILSPILILAVALGVSLLLTDKDLKFPTLAKVLIYIPTLMSPIIVGITWRWIFGENFGFINYMIELLGGDPVKWSTDGTAAFMTIIFAGLWGAVGFDMILIMGRLNSIPKELYEAAAIDGATPAQVFWKITLPLLKPITFLILLLGTINSFKEFAVVQTLTDGGPGIDTTFYVLYIYQIGFEKLKIGYASAASVVLFIFLIILAGVQTKVQKGGEI